MKFAHLGHKTDVLRNPLSKEVVMIASPIINPKGARRKGHLPGDLYVRHLFGEVAIVGKDEEFFENSYGHFFTDPINFLPETSKIIF
jgi:hypothetical protein